MARIMKALYSRTLAVTSAVLFATLLTTIPVSGQVARSAQAQIVPEDSVPRVATTQNGDVAHLQGVVAHLTAQMEEQMAVLDSLRRTQDNPPFPVEVHGLVQAWFAGRGDTGPNAFSMRRAEVAFAGVISPRVAWSIMVDPSKALALQNTYSTVGGTPVITGSSVDQGSHVLQDAFITIEYASDMYLRFGQFHVPLSMEGLEGSGGLESIERALFASDHGRGGFYGDVRDIGLSAFGSVGTSLDYNIGLFNGLGTGIGSAGGKGVAGRVVVHAPESTGLQFGGSSGYADNPRRERYGADVRLDRGPLVLKSEVMAGRDGDARRFGYYGLAAVQIRPRLQAVVRLESWDPDTRAETGLLDVAERNATAGISQHVMGNALKVQANYVRRWFAGALAPSQNVFRINVQTSW